MDTSALATLSDQELIDLVQCAQGLPFEAEVRAVLDARVDALTAERDRLLEVERLKGVHMALTIMEGGPDANTVQLFLDINIEGARDDHRRILLHTLRTLLDHHHPTAHATLGRLYLKGVDPYPKDGDVAFRLFQRGAHAGDGIAIYWLGHCLERGIGCEPDVLRALDWYETGRNTGEIELTVARARLYHRGFGSSSQRDALRALHRQIRAWYDRYWPNGERDTSVLFRDSLITSIENYMREFGARNP